MSFNTFNTKMWYQLLMLTGLPGLGMQTALAGTAGSIADHHQYVIGISAGPVWSMGGSTQTIQSSPQTIRTYSANGTDNIIADGELFIGVQREIKQTFLKSYPLKAQLGLELATTSNANIAGNILDDADPADTNFNYGYHIIHTHIGVKGKLFLESAHKLQPYVSGSIGAGFNQSLHFNNYPTIFEALPLANFVSKINSAFTYSVGAGIQWACHPHWQTGIGYQFSDWGQTQLSAAPNQIQGSGLTENHFYTNGLLFSVNYLA